MLQEEELDQQPQYYQICANILEARDLLSATLDTYVVIKVGNAKKRTKVQRKTDSPYFNEVIIYQYLRSFSFAMHIHIITLK